MADFKVGDRVRAKEAIYEPADDHAPGGYVCGKGDLLIVRKVRDTGKWPLSVSHEDVTDNSFACALDEVVPDGVRFTCPSASSDAVEQAAHKQRGIVHAPAGTQLVAAETPAPPARARQAARRPEGAPTGSLVQAATCASGEITLRSAHQVSLDGKGAA